MERLTTHISHFDGVELRAIKSYGDEDMRAHCRRVDIAAGALREILIPPGAGIELTYAEKRAEALEFLSRSPLPQEYGEFPFLWEDAVVDGITVPEAATNILTRSEAFKMIGPLIERMRRKAKRALTTERDPARIKAILNEVSRETLIDTLKVERGLTDAQIAVLLGL